MKNDIRVIGIHGSPRRGGNTDLLLEKALEGAKDKGARITGVRLADFNITPCRGCLSCFKKGTCIISDDMQSFYRRLLKADIVIFASPIFFYGITGWSKAMVDRCQALWARKYVLHDPALGAENKKKRGFFISVGGTNGPRLFDGAALTVRYFFDAFNADYAGELFVRGVDAQGDILKNPEAIQQAFTAGGKLVAELTNTKNI